MQLLRETPSLTTLEITIYLLQAFPGVASGGSGEPPGAGPLVGICSALSSGRGPLPNICPDLRDLTILLSTRHTTPTAVYIYWLEAVRSMTLARTQLRRPLRRLAVQPVECQLVRAVPAYAEWAERVEGVHAEYASLAAHVEDCVLHRPGEKAIAFATPRTEWG